jgi:hypothetical protein
MKHIEIKDYRNGLIKGLTKIIVGNKSKNLVKRYKYSTI